MYNEEVLVRFTDLSELRGKLRSVEPMRRQIIRNQEDERIINLRFEEPVVMLCQGFADVIGIPLLAIREIVLLN